MAVNLAEKNISDRIRLVTLDGTLDAPNAMAIEDEFESMLAQHTGYVIVDLSGVDYMSSYGLRMLLVGAKALHGGEGGLYLAAPNEHVAKVISVAGYDSMFPVYSSVDEAVSALAV